MCKRNHVLGGGPDHPMGRRSFFRKGVLIVKYRDHLPWALQKRLNRSKYCLGYYILSLVDPRNNEVDGDQIHPWEVAILRGNMPDDTLTCNRPTWAVQKRLNRTRWDTVWVMASGGPKEACIRWTSRVPCKEEIFRGKGHARAAPRHSAVSCATRAQQ